MPGDCFWNCVEALAATFDGDEATVEKSINLCEAHCRQFPTAKRAILRRQLIEIVAGLAQLSTRLAEPDSPRATMSQDTPHRWGTEIGQPSP